MTNKVVKKSRHGFWLRLALTAIFAAAAIGFVKNVTGPGKIASAGDYFDKGIKKINNIK